MQEKKSIGNLLLTALALVMLFGFALAVLSGTVREGTEASYDTEDDDGDDEFDFLLGDD